MTWVNKDGLPRTTYRDVITLLEEFGSAKVRITDHTHGVQLTEQIMKYSDSHLSPCKVITRFTVTRKERYLVACYYELKPTSDSKPKNN